MCARVVGVCAHRCALHEAACRNMHLLCVCVFIGALGPRSIAGMCGLAGWGLCSVGTAPLSWFPSWVSWGVESGWGWTWASLSGDLQAGRGGALEVQREGGTDRNGQGGDIAW